MDTTKQPLGMTLHKLNNTEANLLQYMRISKIVLGLKANIKIYNCIIRSGIYLILSEKRHQVTKLIQCKTQSVSESVMGDDLVPINRVSLFRSNYTSYN